MDKIHFADLVGNTLDIGLKNDHKPSFKDKCIQQIKQRLFIYRLNISDKPITNVQLKLQPWYILSSAQKHFIEFMSPLKTEDEKLITVMQKENKIAQLSLSVFAKSAINDFKNWKKINWEDLKILVASRLQTLSLSVDQLSFIYDQAEIGLIRVFNAKYWLTQYQPTYVLTEYDREFGTSPIIAAANNLNIPTGTMVHGSTYPIHNYWPPIANKVFTWGIKQSEHFIEAGLSQEKLYEAGSTRAKYQLKCTKAQVCERLKLPLEMTYIVFISNNIDINQRHELIKCFASENYKSLNMQLVLKLHPREQKSDYESVPLEVQKNLLILDSAQISSEEAMAFGDAFVGHNSVMLLECLLMNKPVVIMDVIESNAGIGIELHEEGKMPIVRKTQEWVKIAEQLSEPDYRNQLLKDAETYTLKQCERRDVKAASFILNEMTKGNLT